MKLRTEALYRNFGDFVFDTDIGAEEGQLVCLLGPSGCGKTTALRMVAGITQPDAGRVLIGGEDITDLPPWRRNIGMVFQDYALFPHLSVHENIAYGLRTRRWKEEAVRSRVAELLGLVHLPDYGSRSPASLSGGEQQRVALARALAPNPSLLLLDEPLSALDAQLRTRLRREIRSIQRKLGLTTVYVTHDQEEALTMCDRIILMREGRTEQTGSPEQLYRNPGSIFAARFLGSSNLIPLGAAGGYLDRRSAPIDNGISPETGGSEGTAAQEGSVLFFRPEDTTVSLDPPDSGASTGEDLFVFRVPITHIEYLGSHYLAEGGHGDIVLRAVAREDTAPPGTDVYFSVPSSKTRILHETAENAP